MTAFQTGQNYSNYVNGQWIESSTGELAASVNPANRHEVVGNLPMSNRADLDQAVEAARVAQDAWRRLSGAARGEFLYKTANVLERRLNEIAEAMTREMGKTFPEAKG